VQNRVVAMEEAAPNNKSFSAYQDFVRDVCLKSVDESLRNDVLNTTSERDQLVEGFEYLDNAIALNPTGVLTTLLHLVQPPSTMEMIRDGELIIKLAAIFT